jgi:hypothetical protein
MKKRFGAVMALLAIATLGSSAGRAQQVAPSASTLSSSEGTVSARGLCGTGVSPTASAGSDSSNMMGLGSRVEPSRLVSSAKIPGVSTEAAKLLPLAGFVQPNLSSTRSSYIVESSRGLRHTVAATSGKPDNLRQHQSIKFYVGASPLCYLNLTPSPGIATNHRFRVFDDRSGQELGISVFAKEQGAVTIAFAQPVRLGTTLRIERRALNPSRTPIVAEPDLVQYAVSGGQADFTQDVFYGTAQFRHTEVAH